jgi:hypothetical protein
MLLLTPLGLRVPQAPQRPEVTVADAQFDESIGAAKCENQSTPESIVTRPVAKGV